MRPVKAIALQGQTAPGTGGQTFGNGFDEPMVNTSGDVVFQAPYGANNDFGVFLSRGGALSGIATAGQVVAGVGTLSGNFYDGPGFNNSSTVILVASGITASANTPATTDALLQKKVAGSLTVIAKNGDAVPGVPLGVFTNFDDMAQNNNNDVAFIAAYSVDGGPTLWGVFLKPSGGALQTIVKDGDALPNMGGGTSCSSSTPDGPWLNDSGVVTFIADCISGGTVGTEGAMFAKRPAQALESVILAGDAAPPSVGGVLDSSSSAGRPGLNNANQIAMNVETSAAGPCGGQQCAMLLVTLGSPASAAGVCVRGGAPAPDTTGTLTGFGGPAINQSATMVTQADVTGDPNVTNGIFTCQNGTVRAISLEGDPKPGGAPGERFASNQSDPSISDNGIVAFVDFGTTGGVWVSGAKASTSIPTLGEWGVLLLTLMVGGIGVARARFSRHDAA